MLFALADENSLDVPVLFCAIWDGKAEILGKLGNTVLIVVLVCRKPASLLAKSLMLFLL